MATSTTIRSAAPAAETTPVVAAQGLTKIFRDFWMRARARAVEDLDLEIRPREIYGLLGPNGSGKSTTIKIMLGLLHKTRGRLAVFGKPPTDVSIKKRIGVLPEESYLYPFLNARETLDYYGKLFQIDYKPRKRRIDELLDMVGLEAVQHRQIKEYSKGMQRRIGLAQALINDPEFLILDEPTSGLDPIGSRQVKDLIVDLGRRGKTILLSSHQLSDVEDCVTRLAILYGGKKRAEGTCDELLTADSRMIIETEALDDDTVGEIDRVIRQRTGHAIDRVARPRQRLEELFISIVDKAREERLETHGAATGGPTAAFLLEKEDASGEELIDRLMSEEEPRPAAAAAEPEEPADQPPASTGPDESVIEGLVSDRQEQRVERQPEPTEPSDEQRADSARDEGESEKPRDRHEEPTDVDDDLIGSLMDEDTEPDRDQRGGGAAS